MFGDTLDSWLLKPLATARGRATALEHIPDPKAFLARMARFLAPGGSAVVSFGPLFQSPFGDHMYEFFKVQIPWRGAPFTEQAMLRIRREFYRPTDPATCQDIAGGLNLMRYSEFLAYAGQTGWQFRFHRTNALLRHPVLARVNAAVMAVPRLRDYFVHNVYAVLERAPVESPAYATAPRRAQREADTISA